ncbi:MAG TPA: peptidoglycan-binding domain-containing protein [Bryobacteraceae bacterium]
MRTLIFTSILAVALSGSACLLAQSADSVRQAQQALKDKGLDPGPVDGVYGSKTRSALRQYQRQNHLATDGRLGGKTSESLGVKPDTPGGHMSAAGGHIKNSYADGGKQIGQGGKEMGSSLKRGKVTDAGKDLGVGVGKGTAKIGVGTGRAAKSAAKGVKDAFTPSDKKH